MDAAKSYAELARQNEYFRQTIVTGEHAEVVVMTIQPGEDIGEETHEGEQILFFVEGECEPVLVHRTKADAEAAEH